MRKKRNKGGDTTGSGIRVIHCIPGNDKEIHSGLFAWLTIEIDGTLILDGLTLRRTVDGRHAISFPLRRDPKGNRHVLIQPVDSDARRRIESAILQQLDLEPIGGGHAR